MKECIPSEWPPDWCVRYSFNLVRSEKAKFGLGNCRVQVLWQPHSLIKFLISNTSLIILLKHGFLWDVVFIYFFFFLNLLSSSANSRKQMSHFLGVAVRVGWRVTFT